MKIELRSMRVVDCGPLRDVEIDFADKDGKPRQTVLLAGANGSGKTTILELIAILLQTLAVSGMRQRNLFNNSKTILNKLGYAQLDLEVDSKELSIFYGEPPPELQLKENYYSIAIRDTGLVKVDKIQGDVADILRRAISRQEGSIVDFAKHTLTSRGEPQNLAPSVLYLPQYRVIHRVTIQQVGRDDVQYQWVYQFAPIDKPHGSLDSYLLWLEYTASDKFKEVINFLDALNFSGKTFGVSRPDLKAIVRTPDGHEHFLEELSSGEQSILILLLELRRRLLPGSIVLIDEIEHSLHPAFQYRIAEGLKRMRQEIPFQLIATTHAPAFLDIFGAENTLVLTEF